MLLAALHTKLTGYIGLASGALSIIGAVTAFFVLLSNPHYLVSLGYAIAHLHAHTATPDDYYALAQVGGAFIAILGAVVIAILGSYLGLSRFANDAKV